MVQIMKRQVAASLAARPECFLEPTDTRPRPGSFSNPVNLTGLLQPTFSYSSAYISVRALPA